MKIRKQDILLSAQHPSMLLALESGPVLSAPVIVDQDLNLVDGYRRFQINTEDSIEAVQLSFANLFEAAYSMNLRTRQWDDIDCFFWKRWAFAIGANEQHLLPHRYPAALGSAPIRVLALLAQRKITVRQAVIIHEAPQAARDYLIELLSNMISLNDNESAELIRMAWDIKIRQQTSSLRELFASSPFASILQNIKLNPRQRGETLLKEVRALRYPLYQKKLEQFTSDWKSLKLGRGIQTKSNSFVERGVLEISFASASLEELKGYITRLSASIDSPMWARIWEE